HQENVFKNSETDQKRGKYAPFWPVFTYIPDFRLRESDILDKSSKISRLKNIQSSARQKERLRRKTELRHSLLIFFGCYQR
ncbi:hypothetical protein, partial [uncultured Duncaniella sp.]|uniref:hypothetical protein n=1 Tax=uncultured Duncaniella sp. TaxID=2768039 RepID=UPI0025AFE3A9